jgi:hypothetical protein
MSERFGNYELLEKVAVGGMAEIFRARAAHGQGVQKTVCIKRIHPALSADAVFVAMFIEEARLGVAMTHGNIVPVFDFGCIDGRYYLAMEWVEGLDLAALSGRARVVGMRWPPELAAHVVIEVLEGLAYAHQKRDDQGRPLELVHRDVSPSNVLLSLDGQVKLLDFGIARSQAREFETRTGVIKGKPGYMSPEQAIGSHVDARADVWSCGAVLYELVSGERLSDGRRDLQDPELDAIVRRATNAFPKDRHPSARELQQALFSLLDARGARPRASDLAAFIDRVRRAEAPGENWDMRSAAVEQHMAAAIEAGQREAIRTATPEERQATLRVENEVTEGPRTQAVTGGGRSRPKAYAIGGAAALAIAAAIAAATLFRGESGAPAAPQTSDVPDAPAVGTIASGAPAPRAPSQATPAADGGVVPASPVRDADAPRPPHAKEVHGRMAAPAAERKAFLSVNTVPWSNIVLDGSSIGATPIKIDAPREIAPGGHVLVLTNPISGATKTIEFTAVSGEHKIVSERL